MKEKWSNKEVAWFILILFGVILLFSLEFLWFYSMDKEKEINKECLQKFSNDSFILKDKCSNTFQDVWICNMREKEVEK